MIAFPAHWGRMLVFSAVRYVDKTKIVFGQNRQAFRNACGFIKWEV